MTAEAHDWLTLHRVRLKAPRSGTGNPLPGPETATCWRFYPEDGTDGAVWGGFAVHGSRAEAEVCLSAGDAALPFAAEIAEAWHALALPIRHHGRVRWHDEITTDSAVACARKDPGGPLAVLTTGGYDPAPADLLLPRIAEFARRVALVLEDFRTRPQTLRAAVFMGEEVDGREGFTLTLWHGLDEMTQSIYRPGTHLDQLVHHRDMEKQTDRSSFTRLRILAGSGSWDGDPLAGTVEV